MKKPILKIYQKKKKKKNKSRYPPKKGHKIRSDKLTKK